MTKEQQRKVKLVKDLIGSAMKRIKQQEEHWDDIFFGGAQGHHDSPQTCSHSYCVKLRSSQ